MVGQAPPAFAETMAVVTICHQGIESVSEVGKTLYLFAKIRNPTAQILPAQRLAVKPDVYWQPCSVAVPAVPPGCTKEFSFTLSAHNRSEEDVPRTTVFELSVSGERTKVALSFTLFTKALRQYSTYGLPGADGHDRFNIILVGLAGSTKSSFINSCLTLNNVDSPSKHTQLSDLFCNG